MFAMEEAISFFHPEVVFKLFFTSCIAYISALILSDGNNLSSDNFRFYGMKAACQRTEIILRDLLYYMFIGLINGLIGSFFNFIFMHLAKFRAKYVIPWARRRVLEVMAVALITSTVFVLGPSVYEECRELTTGMREVFDITCTSPTCDAQSLSDKVCFPDFMRKEAKIMSDAFNMSYLGSTMSYVSECYLFYNYAEYNISISSMNTSAVDCNPHSYSLFDKAKIQYAYLVSDTSFEGRTNGRGNCLTVEPEYYLNYKGSYSDMKTVTYNPIVSLFDQVNGKVVRNLFFPGFYYLYSIGHLLYFFVIFFILALITQGTALAAGFVLPSLLIGGAVGRIVGVFINTYIKESLGIRLIDPGRYAMVGAASFWTATSRNTITVALIMLEITGDMSTLPGLMIGIIVARVVGDIFNESLTKIILRLKGIPFLPADFNPLLRRLKVMDIMSVNVVSFSRMSTVKEIGDILNSCTHNGFPVLTDIHGKRKVIGLVLRSKLEKYLKEKDYLLLPENYDKIVDISFVMNKSPLCVNCSFPAAKGAVMFRTQGLRHLIVINHSFELYGIITRVNWCQIEEPKGVMEILAFRTNHLKLPDEEAEPTQNSNERKEEPSKGEFVVEFEASDTPVIAERASLSNEDCSRIRRGLRKEAIYTGNMDIFDDVDDIDSFKRR